MDLKPQIALIDDEFDIIDTYKDLLKDKYTVTNFLSAEAYLLHLENHTTNPFVVIVTDYNMSGATGLEMIEKAREINKHTPFILMSGQLNKEMAVRAHSMGLHRVLAKPTRIELIEQEIKSLISEAQIKI